MQMKSTHRGVREPTKGKITNIGELKATAGKTITIAATAAGSGCGDLFAGDAPT